MKNRSQQMILIALTAIVIPLFAAPAIAQNVNYDFHWAASPLTDGNGDPLPEAVAYEVWLKVGSGIEEMIDTVQDTVFTLSAEPGIVQRIRVRAMDAEDRLSVMSEWSDPVYFEGNREIPGMPPTAELGPNYPNPFNPETAIVYAVPEDVDESTPARIEIFAIDGRRVRILDVDRTPGWHEVRWDGTDDRGVVASGGMYVTRLTVGSMVSTGKMTMVK